ncbi:hypothetical protein HNP46_001231 [Pseudomonas nitritireducens]|uniref:Uncharacterized protein n=1 Tax=Pseudomonas nitroreducens TaxID=46680 RepID=A0A7W7KHJ8_PSENT|nr:hypothetical protein [Pseudomonas nitritireducens]MBB4862393.1 hypothetical protein [Pseudomonas nitritireducens]
MPGMHLRFLREHGAQAVIGQGLQLRQVETARELRLPGHRQGQHSALGSRLLRGGKGVCASSDANKQAGKNANKMTKSRHLNSS